MPDSHPSFLDFPPVTLDDWRAQAERELRGTPLARLRTRLHDGIELAPLYTPADRSPAAEDARAVLLAASKFTETRARPWRVVGEYRHPSPHAVHAALRADGPQELSWLGASLVLDHRLAAGFAPAGVATGLVLETLEDVAAVTPRDLVEAGCQSTIVAGCLAEPIIAALVGLSGSAAVRADPLGAWARFGALGIPVERALAELPAAPEHGWIARASGVPYHDAGATPALELALALTTALEYLRALVSRDVPLETAVQSVELELAVDRDLFTSLAKLRAARLLWARVLARCGAAATPVTICARGSWREQARLDPESNLLRATTQAFAAVVGGADELVVPPFDDAFGAGAGAFSRRIARNIQLLLREEAHLDRVADPAGGSWYAESLTDQLARAAWRHVQVIEEAGGVRSALRAGAIQGWIAHADAEARARVGRAALAITGVNRYPQLGAPAFTPRRDPAPRPAEVNARVIPISPGEARGASIAALDAGARLLDVLVIKTGEGSGARERAAAETAIQPLAPARLAEPFEALRARVEGSGARPIAALVVCEPLRAYKPRADFVQGLLATGGIELVGHDRERPPDDPVADFAASGAAVAVLCARDDRYPGWAPELAPRLREAGARLVLLAGRPADPELRDMLERSGVDGYVHLGCDALAVTERALAAHAGEEGGR
ncbi:MAG: hypothetical protein H6713_10690 [Myxococcales bacterium]|nr:hypothetical protein [Myxococcales bacterium]